ncbi:surfeit locus 1 family protein [Limnobacter thiooxidans]|uniref:SURF1-like protein n=1 Tax=Limnobacter thiooxidans TaxID=131080 RepID=A0AA86MEG6_9BURK|nr:SURF1 family cytochrome oxidase biogenesis protein [Limnobacter sp.]MCZ8015581.1 SURF1 family protein [Limnobacter sp.]RZS42665.1 surfeit locus 1 family protein [Limnobacter thiooxidans]BET25900.1 SURF1 family protein [Limnobacter thiooxidans]
MSEVSKTHSASAPAANNSIKRLLGFVLAAFFFAVFFSLGTWQVYRLDYKLDLIERVQTRVHANPVAAPAQAEWISIARDTHEYLNVKVQGELLPQYTTRVQATTALGAGHWLMTPLRTPSNEVVWINRGYIPAGEADPMTPQNTRGLFQVQGLLRISEAGGAYLRKNDPAADRWYSRDVAALSARHKLEDTAPYFIDAGKPRNLGEEIIGFTPKTYPVDGLTVIKFHNSHLVYAFTWYALALMVAGVTYWLNRR